MFSKYREDEIYQYCLKRFVLNQKTSMESVWFGRIYIVRVIFILSGNKTIYY